MLHIKRRKSVPYQSFALSPPTHPLCRPSAVLRTGDALAEASDTVMIRAFSLLLKLKTSGLSDLHLFEILTETALRCPGPCPSCGSSFPAYRQMQPYSRFMISAENGKRVERQISVQRLRCSLCAILMRSFRNASSLTARIRLASSLQCWKPISQGRAASTRSAISGRSPSLRSILGSIGFKTS